MSGDSHHLQPHPQGAPPDYDPRRLFPFGLSPIPEVPSELASEVSSICPSPSPGRYTASCYESEEESDEDEEEEEDEEDDEELEDEESDVTEVESVKSAGIRHSGSCSSARSNETLNNNEEEEESEDSEEDSSSEKEESSEEEDEYESNDECEEMLEEEEAALPEKDDDEHVNAEEPADLKSETSVTESENPAAEETAVKGDDDDANSEESESDEDDDGQDVASEAAPYLQGKSGADTASEIFRHLQATREKSEVKTELAKILTVLEKTLKDKEGLTSRKSDSSGSDESNANPRAVTSKPPKHPISSGSRSESGRSKVSRKEESGILSKILVTLLCSCKSPEAADELKQVIRQFRDAAHEASDEVRDELLAAIPSGRSSRASKSSKKSWRTRRSSGSSSHSTDSQTNTLTPNNTDSKSSEDESAPTQTQMRRGSKAELISGKVESNIDVNISIDGKVILEPTSTEKQDDPNICVTLTLPNGANDGQDLIRVDDNED